MNAEFEGSIRAAARSALLVSAARSDRIEKALAGMADAVVIDLDDAVPVTDKQDAREALARFLQSHPGVQCVVRINAPDSPEHEADLALCRCFDTIIRVMIPGVASADSLAPAAALGRPIWALIESASGLQHLFEITRVAGVERLAFGAFDLALDLDIAAGTAGGEILLDQARFTLILQSRLAGLMAPLAEVSPIISDSEALRATARRALDMGFGGMLCLHPAQPGAVNEAFTPSAAQLEWARRVLADADTAGFMIDGEPMSASLVHRARRLLARGEGGRAGRLPAP
ncbi:(S)-citramalyl-CoA lyase [Kushneria sinocarnis]|uniref:(S)-citramalyl-CoA lyase n=1 Tax=Kushneria sinocarnis TaxID=595502 RepID=A0A420WU50_9GAMM|nr:CoA ester lyase [Kushneria sinocarnis]RKQ96973.1 (S)-citramalyl-CoA lyase [Kushneria sinocarnis]